MFDIFKKQGMCSSDNEPFAMSHFIKRLFKNIYILLYVTSMNKELNLTIFDASPTLSSICNQTKSVSRLIIMNIDVGCDWVVVGGN